MLFNKWGLIIVTPNLFVGGAEKVAVSLANEAVFTSSGPVLVLSLNGVGRLKDKLDPRVSFVDLKSSNKIFILVRLFVFMFMNKGPLISCQKASNVYVGICNIVIRRKNVLFREASTLNASAISWLKIRSMRLAYKSCKWVIANSEDTKNDLLIYRIVNEGKCKVIGNPVIPRNLKVLCQENIVHKWFNSHFKIILSVGRLEAVKDHATIINAMKYLVEINGNYRLIIIGDGVLKETLTKQAYEFGIHDYVDFVSFSDNVFAYMNNANVFVSSSIWEGFGNTIVEAMGCGIPVVGYDCPGGARVLIAEDPASTLIHHRSIDELVKEIDHTINRNAQKVKSPVAEQYGVSAIFEKYFELIL